MSHEFEDIEYETRKSLKCLLSNILEKGMILVVFSHQMYFLKIKINSS